ncbi:MAG: hypothetical protein LAT68_17130, partial [Cyclobacteriaceae bacterium]|nr:hypothetical protein [Cyclobacteriaceae bacterium]
ALYVEDGSVIADVTYGKGAFWKKVPESKYRVLKSDLKTGVDCRKLPYPSDSVDAVVLDPPYMEGLLRADDSIAGKGTHDAFQEAYSNGERPTGLTESWHDAVVELYVQAAKEALRVLKPKASFLIVKCQDEVSAGVQRLTHVEIIMNYINLRLYPRDLFVLTRTNKPGVSRSKRQLHARKNHSYFLVFQTGATPSKLKCVRIFDT